MCIFSLTHFLLFSQPHERNPFEFKQEIIEPSVSTATKLDPLSKWNIKENGDELIIIENIDDGQIRTIEIASF